jgi:hypothetical protein
MTTTSYPATDILFDILIERIPDDDIYTRSAELEAAARADDWETVQALAQDIMTRTVSKERCATD